MESGRILALGALLAGLGVTAGAFGAHALEPTLEAAGQLENWHTAVRYQVWHALAIVAFALWRERVPGGRAVAWCFGLGTLFFSGSIYLLALEVGAKVVWPFTPLGGLLLIVGWGLFGVEALRSARRSA